MYVENTWVPNQRLVSQEIEEASVAFNKASKAFGLLAEVGAPAKRIQKARSQMDEAAARLKELGCAGPVVR